MKSEINAIVAAGGTGGHLFPALAVVEAFKLEEDADFTAHFVGNPERLESRIIPEEGYAFTPIPIKGFSGLLTAGTLLMPFRVLSSVNILRKMIKKNKPDFVLCTGAYLSYPAGVAASNAHVPLVIMESNVNPGKTIKLLAPKADIVVTSYEKTKDYFAEEIRPRVRCLGNPLRRMFYEQISKIDARAEFGLSADKPTVLIFGGSLGARAINDAAEKLVTKFPEAQFIWQTGKSYQSAGSAPKNVHRCTFIDHMKAAYEAADLVVSRSGATSVAELTEVGKPAILIPLPSASNDEQAANASETVKAGAAVIINNAEAGEKLEAKIRELLSSPETLEKMGQAMKSLARPDAAADVVKEIRKLIKK